MSTRKVLRGWRFQEVKEGMYVFFDPTAERIEIHPLTSSERSDMVSECDSGDAFDSDSEDTAISKQREIPWGSPHLLEGV